MEFAAHSTVEFGCGTGSNIPFLIELVGSASVVGIDTSGKSLEVARNRIRIGQGEFLMAPGNLKPGPTLTWFFATACSITYRRLIAQPQSSISIAA